MDCSLACKLRPAVAVADSHRLVMHTMFRQLLTKLLQMPCLPFDSVKGLGHFMNTKQFQALLGLHLK